ncbi:unnamed protein product [Lactuca saligna]|uniref:Uncharacterized protein n=1 Tax=Lactuca saligna TaxID=75948 RepID=A0AA35V2K8_LACSI|nr:unnamed protein product [Lactuca saligna]
MIQLDRTRTDEGRYERTMTGKKEARRLRRGFRFHARRRGCLACYARCPTGGENERDARGILLRKRRTKIGVAVALVFALEKHPLQWCVLGWKRRRRRKATIFVVFGCCCKREGKQWGARDGCCPFGCVPDSFTLKRKYEKVSSVCTFG